MAMIDKIGDICIEGKKIWELNACMRCGGTGIYTEYHGTCFRCNGIGHTDKDWYRIDAEAVKNRERYAERKRKENEKKVAEARAKIAELWEELKVRSPELYDISNAVVEKFESRDELTTLSDFEHFIYHGFVSEFERFKNLPDWAIENAERRLESERAKKDKYNAAEDVPTGKIELSGEVLSVKFKNDGFGGGVLKCLFMDDRGFKVWGTVSKKFEPNHEGRYVGNRYSFEATVDASSDDPKFGFYKRPTKIENL